MTENGAHYDYLYDGKGNVRAVINGDSSQSVAASYAYDEFGVLAGQSGTLDQPYRFSTKYYYPSFGGVYFGYRFNLPFLGRWMTRDPLGEAGGVNLYGFVGNGPMNAVDAWGLAKAGDIVFFNWYGENYPHHLGVVAKVDKYGNATNVFAAWGDSLYYHEVDLSKYNGGIQDNIIGYGDMTDLNSLDLEKFIKEWGKVKRDPDWNGYNGYVCVDEATDVNGYGGEKLRDAMKQDYNNNPEGYPLIKGDPMKPNPENEWFYRKNPWLLDFFINTGRYENRFKNK